MGPTSSTRTSEPRRATPARPAFDHGRLDYTRTVDRLLVHRDALSEVFLTDLRHIDETSYAAAAQLPRSHAYYGDHLLRPAHFDPLLVLEACRQATLAGAHRFFGAAESDKFILTHLGLRLTRPWLLAVGTAPLPLALRVRVTNRRERDGRTTGLDHTAELTVGGEVVGEAEVGLRFRTPTDYLTLRLGNRDGRPLPSSASYPGIVPAGCAPAHLAGRSAPENAVLLDPAATGTGITAGLRVPVGHPSMFDHPQDHLPGMVIVEGARQLALYAGQETHGLAVTKAYPTEVLARFERFGELEEETTLHATVGRPTQAGTTPRGPWYTQAGVLDDDAEDLPDLGAPGPADGEVVPERLPVRVEARQRGTAICAVDVTLSRVPEDRAARGGRGGAA
ncbi:AfsA-related hotdog domain-containing protein [Streptomyces triticirhizae]|uniref:A-factor biosynthesis protein n=1 Tax=Streptomyces triticirhizae TaxID=2483353 RepID=A0A3M2L1V5_9ACTN|nr:AfsA-related hotdog domain-containing protein [Streptomyces triticirhizae]RMI30483.1 A-factor biosynthesis protein [Streptomyces triticirhizae]